MNGSYLLDTNIVIALIGGESTVTQRAGQAARVYLSTTVVGELFYGAYRSARAEANVASLEQFVGDREVLACDAETARFYGQVKHALRVRGRPIPENDIWIAATARQHGLALATRDHHFPGSRWVDDRAMVDGLRDERRSDGAGGQRCRGDVRWTRT